MKGFPFYWAQRILRTDDTDNVYMQLKKTKQCQFIAYLKCIQLILKFP